MGEIEQKVSKSDNTDTTSSAGGKFCPVSQNGTDNLTPKPISNQNKRAFNQ